MVYASNTVSYKHTYVNHNCHINIAFSCCNISHIFENAYVRELRCGELRYGIFSKHGLKLFPRNKLPGNIIF